MSSRKKEDGNNSLPLYKRIAFGSGHFMSVMAVAMWFPYNVSFYEKVVGLTPKSTGTIILIAQVVGAISTPFVGMWSDQCSCKYGRRKIFHIIGTIAVAAPFFFMWHECLGCHDTPEPYQVLYFSSFAVVFQFGWAAVQISQLSLIPELTINNTSKKVELISLRYAFTLAAFLLVFGCFWGLLEGVDNSSATNLTPADRDIFWIMALVAIGVGLFVSMFFQIFIHEDRNAILPKLRWYKWFMKPEFYLVSSMVIAARIVTLIPQTYMPLYFLNTLKMDKASIAKGPLIFFLSCFFTSFIVKPVSKAIGNKMTFFIGMAIVWAAIIWFWLKDPTDDAVSQFNWGRDSIYGATILMGIGGATMVVISMTLVAYIVGPHTGSSAYVFGWTIFAERMSIGFIVKIIQQLTPGSSRLPEFYRHVLIFAPFAATGLGILIITLMLVQKKLHKRKSEVNPSVQSNDQNKVTSGNSCLTCCNLQLDKVLHRVPCELVGSSD